MRSRSTAGRALLVGAALAFAAAAAVSAQPRPGAFPAAAALYRGVLVLSVEPGSPAAAAGLARGDIVLAINGRDVNATGDLTQAVLAQRVGDQVLVRFLHGDVDRTATVVLGSRGGLPFLGVLLEPALPGPEAQADPWFRAAATGRVDGRAPWLRADAVVAGVALRSPAWRAGLLPGDRVTAIEGLANPSVRDVLDVLRSHAPGDVINITVIARGSHSEQQVAVDLGHSPFSSAAWLGVELGGGSAARY